MGIDVDVLMSKNIVAESNNLGESLFQLCQIKIADIEGYPQQLKEETFCHELVHWILHAAGKYDLRNDEEFVSLIAGLLYQFFKTAKY
jgi:predicted SprT family Zn-dependent metalloprotease